MAPNRDGHLRVEGLGAYGHLDGVERVLELVGVRLVDASEYCIGRRVRGGCEEDKLDACARGGQGGQGEGEWANSSRRAPPGGLDRQSVAAKL